MAVVDAHSGEGSPRSEGEKSSAGSELDPSPAPPDAPTLAAPPPTAITAPRQAGKRRVARAMALTALVAGACLLIAPVIAAVIVALAALATDILSLLAITRYLYEGRILDSGGAMGLLSVSSRVGFAALGYLAVICALMSLIAGLLGRGRARLFVVPGAMLSICGLLLVSVGVYLCWPLVAPLHAPRVTFILAAAYLALDAVAFAMLMTDTRITLSAWLRRRARARTAASRLRREPPAAPPTLAGA